MFDPSCQLNEELRNTLLEGVETEGVRRDDLVADLVKVLKVGFRGGGFMWKSEVMYKKVGLRMGVSLHDLLKFLVKSEVLQIDEVRGGGSGIGYVVSKRFRDDAKQLIVNSVVTVCIETIIAKALGSFGSKV